MENRLQKWGNSKGVRIPKVYLDSLGLQEGDLVDVLLVEDKIVISKAKKKGVSLKDKIESYQGPNLCKEFVWDESEGREIW